MFNFALEWGQNSVLHTSSSQYALTHRNSNYFLHLGGFLFPHYSLPASRPINLNCVDRMPTCIAFVWDMVGWHRSHHSSLFLVGKALTLGSTLLFCDWEVTRNCLKQSWWPRSSCWCWFGVGWNPDPGQRDRPAHGWGLPGGVSSLFKGDALGKGSLFHLLLLTVVSRCCCIQVWCLELWPVTQGIAVLGTLSGTLRALEWDDGQRWGLWWYCQATECTRALSSITSCYVR